MLCLLFPLGFQNTLHTTANTDTRIFGFILIVLPGFKLSPLSSVCAMILFELFDLFLPTPYTHQHAQKHTSVAFS